ncbi:MAG: hypothetical protein HRT44_09020 [Bdellovibrionales bacterium]|nr:hypothetical protein [Bdellovibrionales bacterium]
MKRVLLLLPFLFLSSCGYFASIDNSNSISEGSSLAPQEVNSSKVVSVISQNQILPNFKNCLGLERDQISNATRQAHRESIESLAPEGNVNEVSAPMLMAVTKITSELCNDLITAEAASDQSRFFPNFNLNDNESTGSGSIETATRNLASACWAREATTEEINLITTSIEGISTLNGNSNKDTALYICTAVLSSSQAIRF